MVFWPKRGSGRMVLWLLLGSALTVRAQAEDRCVECHARSTEPELRLPAEQVPQSAHRHPTIGCVGCHGGDPEDPTVRAHAPERGYVGRPRPAEIPNLCGGCHSDARFIRRLSASLPIDQLVLYGPSRHGVLAAAGDDAAPVCTTCHGHHDVRSARDPEAPVHPLTVAALCGSCHSDPERMAPFQCPTLQVAQWERSVHARALRSGVPRAPSCTGCHGSHGEMPAAVASVARGCVSCHLAEFDAFQRSAHASAFEKQGFTECVPCHGNHEVLAPRPLWLGFGPEGSCNTCHAKDLETKQASLELATELRQVAERAQAARAQVAGAIRSGRQVAGAEAALAELQTAELELKPIIHTLDPEALRDPLAQVTDRTQAVAALVAQAEQRRATVRGVTGLGLGLCGLLFLLLCLKSWRLARRSGR